MKIIKFAFVLLTLSACNHNSPVIKSPVISGGKNAGNATMTFDMVNPVSLKIMANLALDNGEIYQGQVKQDIVEEQTDFIDYSINEALGSKEPYTYKVTYGSTAVAELREIKTNKIMSCQFTLSDPQMTVYGGGVGQCVADDGRKIPFTY